MKQYKQIWKCMLIFSIMVSCLACKDEEAVLLTVEPAQLDFDGDASSRLIKIVSSADWVIDLGDNDWIRVDQSSGAGDGNMRLIDVGIDKNETGDRTGTILVRAGGEVRTITLVQRSAMFGTPVLSRTVGAYLPIENTTLDIPYSGFRGDESFTVSLKVHGVGSPGFDEVVYPVTLTASSGIISIPLSGTPTKAGTINITVSTDYPGYSIAPAIAVVNRLRLGQAKLLGFFEVSKEAQNVSIEIPYSGAAGYEAFTMSISMDGAGAEGIDPVIDYPVQVDKASGTISIPITGTPTASGKVNFEFESSFPGTSIEKLETSVFGKVYLNMDFDLMKLGGDEIANLPGIILDHAATPWDLTTDPDKLSLPANPVYKACSATNLGPGLLGTGPAKVSDSGSNSGAVSDSYKTLRGLIGNWTGANVFEQPGYIAFGYSSGDGSLITPPLSEITGTANVRVSFRIAKRSHPNTVVKVTVNGGGTILGGENTFPISATGVWEQKGFTILGATQATTIRFENNVSESNARKFSLDDLTINSVE